MTEKSITMETATLADAITKAARIAPTKGAAYDKAAGIKIDVDPTLPYPVTVTATDLDVSIMQQLNALETGGEACSWRLPANLLPDLLMKMPLGHGATVTLAEKDKDVTIKAGKLRGKLRRISDDLPYPLIHAFDPSDVAAVPGLASRIQQVGWATSTEQGSVLSGVHIDGEHLFATDRYKLVEVPCDVPVEAPITAQINPLLPLLQTGDVKLGAHETKLLLMPDDYTQITASIIAHDYPEVTRVMRDDFTGEFTVDKQLLMDSLNRMMVLVKSERYPIVKFTIEAGVLLLKMDPGDEVGMLEDELDTSDFTHTGEAFEVDFTPTYVTGALAAAHGDHIKFHYGPDALKLCLFTDTDNMRAFIMPRRQN